jgi:hypothetical protein
MAMHPIVIGRVGFELTRDEKIRFVSGGMATRGSVELAGASGENAAGWKLGFFQLQFIETNYARYRGRSTSDGSAKVTRSHQILCRDSFSTASGNLWYAPQNFDPSRVQGVFNATMLSATGTLLMTSGINDAPRETYDIKVLNTRTRQQNFLYHADIAFHFCAMLVAENPHHQFTVLKHFYWNVHWEAHFEPDVAGKPRLTRTDHFALNVQRQVHSGVPNDSRFKNHIFSRSLPISNTVAQTRAPRTEFSNDWSLS